LDLIQGEQEPIGVFRFSEGLMGCEPRKIFFG